MVRAMRKVFRLALSVPFSVLSGCLVLSGATILSGCALETGDVASLESAAIYGTDDRTELYESTDATLQEIGRRSVAALMDARFVDRDGLRTISLGELLMSNFEVPACEEVPFLDQPAIASCTGTLIDDDLVLTASHCVPTQEFCDDLAIVFDYHYAAAGRLEEIGPEDVYTCESIEVISYLRDQAIIRLDREVEPPHQPATVREGEDLLRAGDRLSVLSHGLGLPLKYDDNAEAGAINTNGIDTFYFASDIFGGSSGAPIFDRRNEIVGVVSRGPTEDFNVGRCVELEEEDVDEGPLQVASYVYRTMHKLCNGGPGSERLCRDKKAWCPTDCGGGGCAAGGEVGGGALLFGLALVVAARRRRRR